jgi:hypothetical protein
MRQYPIIYLNAVATKNNINFDRLLDDLFCSVTAPETIEELETINFIMEADTTEIEESQEFNFVVFHNTNQ